MQIFIVFFLFILGAVSHLGNLCETYRLENVPHRALEFVNYIPRSFKHSATHLLSRRSTTLLRGAQCIISCTFLHNCPIAHFRRPCRSRNNLRPIHPADRQSPEASLLCGYAAHIPAFGDKISQPSQHSVSHNTAL